MISFHRPSLIRSYVEYRPSFSASERFDSGEVALHECNMPALRLSYSGIGGQ